MGLTFRSDKWYHDEANVGISTGINFDGGLSHFDVAPNSKIEITGTTGLYRQSYIAREHPKLNIELILNLIENYSKYVDLMQLVPRKFHNSVVWQQFIEEAGLMVGNWISKINDIELILDKYSVGDSYIQKLADLIDLTIISDDTTTLAEKRRQLVDAIDWYKRRGLYRSLHFIAYLLGLNVIIWDLYTNNYSAFVRVPWFVGQKGENPPGLDSSYYKSPHLGIEIILNKLYEEGANRYLFKGSEFTNLSIYFENIRPINVVPRFTIFLNPITTEMGTVYITEGDIRTRVRGDWVFSRKYFDGIGSLAHNFDDGKFFDYTEESALNAITRWKLGNGNKGVDPNPNWTDLQHTVLSGTIGGIRIYADRVEYEFEVNTPTSGLSELGLFLSNGTTLRVISTFPDIVIVSGLSLRVVVTVYK